MSVTGSVVRGRWTGAERARLSGMAAVIAALHVIGWSLYLYYSRHMAAAGPFAGAGTLAYALGVRHAFDADHIAAIDDTTRLMVRRGRRPLAVGFFFSLGHSSVVLALSLVIAITAGAAAGGAGVRAVRAYGGLAAAGAGMAFLLLVAVLNTSVLAGLLRTWRALARGDLDPARLERLPATQGLMSRLLGGRVRGVIRSSWHMFGVGVLFGLGLETASEIALLSLSAASAASGRLPVLASLALPLLFAAGMSAFDTGDGLLMTRAYSWAYASPARRLFYNAVTTGMTVIIAVFVATVYLAGLLRRVAGPGGPVGRYASLGGHFELIGYAIVALFLAAWAAAAVGWRLGGFERRYGRSRP